MAAMFEEMLSWRKNSCFTASPAIYRDQCLLHFIQERYVAACFDCCALFEAFNEQYPSLFQKIDPITLEADFFIHNFFGLGESPCLHSLDYSFVSGLCKCIHVSFIVTVEPRSLLCSAYSAQELPLKPPNDHISDSHSYIFAPIWQRHSSYPTHHGWWT
jgi:hypothetical protein